MPEMIPRVETPHGGTQHSPNGPGWAIPTAIPTALAMIPTATPTSAAAHHESSDTEMWDLEASDSDIGPHEAPERAPDQPHYFVSNEVAQQVLHSHVVPTSPLARVPQKRKREFVRISGRMHVDRAKADALGNMRVQLEKRVKKQEITEEEMLHQLGVFSKEINTPRSVEEHDKHLEKRAYRTAGYAIKRNSKTFDNSPKDCRFPYLEQFTVHVLGTCSENVQFDNQFASMVAEKCLFRILEVQPLYREIYRMKDLPRHEWIGKVLLHSQHRRLSQYGDRGLVGETHAVKNLGFCWNGLQNYPPDCIFNVNQTCQYANFDNVGSVVWSAGPYAGRIKGDPTYTLNFCMNVDGSRKITTCIIGKTHYPGWASSYQNYLNFNAAPRPAHIVEEMEAAAKEECKEEEARLLELLVKHQEIDKLRDQAHEAHKDLPRGSAEKKELLARHRTLEAKADEAEEIYNAAKKCHADQVANLMAVKLEQWKPACPFEGEEIFEPPGGRETLFSSELLLPIIKERTTKVRELEGSVATLEVVAQGANKKFQAEEKILKGYKKNIQKVRAEITALEGELKDLEAKLADFPPAADTIDVRSDSFNVAEFEIAQDELRRAAIVTESNIARSKLESKHKRLEALQADVSNAVKSRDDHKREIRRAEDELSKVIRLLVLADDEALSLTGPGNTMGMRYFQQNRGWMDTVTFCKYMLIFSRESGAGENRKIALILDNVGFHHRAWSLSKKWPEMAHVKLFFLPPNSTPFTQPLDLGPICRLKSESKKLQNEFINLTSRLNGTAGKVTVLHKFNYINKSLLALPADHIHNCFRSSPVFAGHPTVKPTESILKRITEREKQGNAAQTTPDTTPRVVEIVDDPVFDDWETNEADTLVEDMQNLDIIDRVGEANIPSAEGIRMQDIENVLESIDAIPWEAWLGPIEIVDKSCEHGARTRVVSGIERLLHFSNAKLAQNNCPAYQKENEYARQRNASVRRKRAEYLNKTTEAPKDNRMNGRRSSPPLGKRPPAASPESVAVDAPPSPPSGVFDTPSERPGRYLDPIVISDDDCDGPSCFDVSVDTISRSLSEKQDIPGSVSTLGLFDTPGSASWIQDTPYNVFSLAQQDAITPYEAPTLQTGFVLKLPSAEALQKAQRLLADHGMLELV